MIDKNAQQSSPLVSIAMATYNGYTHLTEQLQSIFAQTFTNWELVVVDDCSTDRTVEVLEKYKDRDKRIKLFFNNRNLGYRQTFYKALEHCSGEYILFCDQDDRWLPHKIETLLQHIGTNLLVFSDSELVDEKGDSLNIKLSDTVRMVQPGNSLINRGFVIGNCVWGHTILFHKNLLQYTGSNHNEHPHDWWFGVVSSLRHEIAFCPQVLNQYRQHASNVTQAIPTGRGMVKGRKKAEYELQLSRLEAMANLPFNTDKVFYERWRELWLVRQNGFSLALFRYLFIYRQGVFAFKRKSALSQLIEIRKMCRKV